MQWTTREELHFDSRVVRCFTDRPATLVAMLDEAIQANAEADAVVDERSRLTFRDLDVFANGIAAHLQRLGLSAGDRLGLLMPNGWPFVAVFVGAMRCGVVPVPINIRAARGDIAFILEDCSAGAVAVEPALSDRLPEGARSIICSTDALERLADGNRPTAVAVAEEDAAALLYTSGTTGKPKGVILTHLNLVHTCLHYRRHFNLGPNDRTVCAVPATHVTGFAALILAPLASAGTVLIMKSFEVEAFLHLAASERMTWTILVPAMYKLCLMRARLADYDLGAWRIGAYGGAPMPEATIEALAAELPNLALVNAYGATETTSPATLMPLDDAGRHASSVGRVVACGELRIMDDAGHEVPPGVAGEVWIKGPMVVPGYWKRPEETASAFKAGFWRSGDIGSVDAEGYLRLSDRKKDLINRGGYKISSVEVENVLQEHEAVADAAVVPAPDPVLGEIVHAFVQLRSAVSREELRAFCAHRLADYKLPDEFTLSTDPLPRNANGKLQKQVLRERLQAAVDLSSK